MESEFKEDFDDEIIEHKETFVDEIKQVKNSFLCYVNTMCQLSY